LWPKPKSPIEKGTLLKDDKDPDKQAPQKKKKNSPGGNIPGRHVGKKIRPTKNEGKGVRKNFASSRGEGKRVGQKPAGRKMARVSLRRRERAKGGGGKIRFLGAWGKTLGRRWGGLRRQNQRPRRGCTIHPNRTKKNSGDR